MKNIIRCNFMLFTLLVSLLSCSNEVDRNLEKAYYYHMEANKLRRELDVLMEKESVYAPSDGLYTDILSLLGEWDDNFVEVPGYEHEHSASDKGHHRHHHQPIPNITPLEHLYLQKSLYEDIKLIYEKFVLVRRR
ncbi:hypothetical protein [Anditalea andensis]|uniref:Uncharacterized protein n=1 Tax=Anditalea andensis TaxID=1048983 RepID=A0A074LLB5_9BACT|nr:hypothetical protein [Anditalea andensis]KEO74617.1 hypothetical protein EL17_02785 [Anditalea andensis]